MADEKIIDSKQIYDGRVVKLHIETVQLDDGDTYEREVIRHSGAVAILPFDEDGNIYMVRQFRTGAGGDLLELPAGQLEPGEPPEVCARRELQEEIGMYPEELVELGGFYVAASYTSEFITIFMARGLRESVLPGDKDERIEIVKMPFEEAVQMAYRNEVYDSKTLIGLMWAAQRLGG
ncbi:MAG TPA: NUDIX hydrolase [Aggregatilineales bacterium]|nr:NUDIX hydrolase [Chloroflexota bacterium]HOA24602.1 NUDIX hydrolase [Aggregatilineales bacterium]HPV07896.1 NUDIX hydrolase [Aggregatilineales bacterium]HQA67166.1 NUDIX hydrolase [Aggregatilineales bacterium]HQE17282.1 NUDIX hydrolase [Aggregatilineales bacterium]